MYLLTQVRPRLDPFFILPEDNQITKGGKKAAWAKRKRG